MKKSFGEYYLGLDIGTDSVGWAVTDLQYNVCRLNGKSMWGVRLFEAGKTAEERRLHRSARRRQARRTQRIKLLQELFSREICKVDDGFFQRLQDSKYIEEDKTIFQKYTLFSDLHFNDVDYYKKFPTIYHLRKALIENKEAYDIRLVYLALHHILKKRGHFLFEGRSMENISDFKEVYSQTVDCLRDELEVDFSLMDTCELEDILKNREMGIRDKEKAVSIMLSAKTKQEKAICGLLVGATKSLAEVFADESLSDCEVKKISFKDAKYEEQVDVLADILAERFLCIEKLKAIYDWATLAEIRSGEKYLSFAKVKCYEKHKSDLVLLKNVVRRYIPGEYKEIFSTSGKGVNNYASYIGTPANKKGSNAEGSPCSQEDLCKYLVEKLKKIENQNSDVQYLMNELENRTLLPKQITRDNGVIPYQMNKEELEVILDNAAKYLPFLNEEDESGFQIKDKILKILEFRIPYYVGPLNDAHKDHGGNCWIVRKKNEPVRPWNFETVVDTEASAEAFIQRMTNKCTYLVGADVLPKNSLLYSKFMVLNELNNLKINDELISVDLKQELYDGLFKQSKKVTGKRLRSYLEKEGIISKNDEISGIDGDFKAGLISYNDFYNIVPDKVTNIDMVEDLIRWIVLFGEDKKLLIKRITQYYGDILSAQEIKKICNLKYSGWGRLSKEFLTEIYHVDKSTGECISIITALLNTNYNLMQLLSCEFSFASEIKKYNEALATDKKGVSYDLLEDLYLSPSVKRSVWQTLCITEELRKVMGRDPKKIFVEMARGEEEKKRTISRKNHLLDLYNKCKDEERDWQQEIGDKDESKLRSDRLYLYYTQMGRCMYTGEPISLSQLYDANVYDTDHIFPQSKIKDDSLDNRVLVKRGVNAGKSDVYPLDRSIQEKCKSHWSYLLKNGFISKKKYERLVRTQAFTDSELADFIARQLVETRQSTKAVAEILKSQYDNAEIVYVKAGNVSTFRQQFGLTKVRAINDYHHAKDAYLNIIVGNVYNTKFTHSPANFMRDNQQRNYNLRRMYDFNVERAGVKAWEAGENGTIALVKKMMAKNSILFTRYAFEVKGALFDQILRKAGQGQVPIKGADVRLHNIAQYGGYNKAAGAYFMLVRHTVKGKRVKTIEYVPVYMAKILEADASAKEKYCVEQLGRIEPEILLDKIKINTLFNVEGFRMHISGRTGNQLIFKGANQLCLSVEQEHYIKKITKFVERSKALKRELMVDAFDEISKEENLQLYDTLIGKLDTTVYSIRLSSQAATLKAKRSFFIDLPVESQCKQIEQLLCLFQCNSVAADLHWIDGPKSAGILVLSNDITKLKQICIVHQSVTGLFEKTVDLGSL